MTVVLIIYLMLLILFAAFLYFSKEKPTQPRLLDPDINNYRIAIHEVGHLMAAWFCTDVTRIVSCEINDISGKVKYYYTAKSSAQQNWCLLVITLAGISAEGMCFKSMESGHFKTDLKRAFILANHITKQNPDYHIPNIPGKSVDFNALYTQNLNQQELNVLSNAYKFSKQIFNSYIKEFYQLAVLLQQNKSLSYNQIEKILPSRFHVKFSGLFQASSFIGIKE